MDFTKLLRGICGHILNTLLLFILCVPLSAQNVTISPNTGSLIAALTESSTETGFKNGWSALWRHEQLPLSFTVSDDTDLTDGGEIAKPAGNLYVYKKNNTVGEKIVMAGGQPYDGYMVLSLPKGYRITGYKMVLLNNLNNTTVSGINAGNQDKTVYETGSDYNYNNYLAKTPTMGGTNSDTQEYVIERTSTAEDGSDMGNQLYFTVVHSKRNYFLLTIKSFEVWFTAEGTFSADVKPQEVGQAVAVASAPFQTSKMDFGDMKVQTKDGRSYFAYDYSNVRDLTGYTWLYQDDAVYQGAPMDAAAANKNIMPVKVDGKTLYAFNNDTYYIESPTTVHTQSGLEAPVGYRIVGARFNYLWGTETEGGTETLANAYYITARNWGTTYYLNGNLQLTTTRTAWSYDSETGNLYTGSGNNIKYLSCSGSGDTRTLTTSTEKGNYYNLIVFTRNNTTYIGWDNETASQRFYLRYDYDWWNEVYTLQVSRNNTNNAFNGTVADTETIDLPDFSPGTYTLKVYDKNGENPKEVAVTESNAGGIIELTDLNNDAVKFEIADLATGKQALVSITLDMQALNPYIDQMDIVCHDPNDQLQMTQTFTADDFSVSGGSFVFYIPEDYWDTELTFTFSDLWSKYGDKTYYEGTSRQKDGNARYSFVTSDYFGPIDGNGDDGLYDDAYDPNASYESKILTSTTGNIRWKFNNAEDLGNNQTGTGYLEEYPFTVENYLGSSDPDAETGETPETGAFIDCKLKASSDTQKSGTYYVFTADETRYNIAPTTAWQHRYYAFYRMDIELVAKEFTPALTWEKIYDKTYYTYTDKEDKTQTKTNSMWGVKLNTSDVDAAGKHIQGYLTYKQLFDGINSRLTGTEQPNDPKQVLYIDASELLSLVQTSELTLDAIKGDLGENLLVFLPKNTTSTEDNFAYMTSSGSFRAGKDIVLKDKNPFYSPYDIQVDAANVATYTREITVDKNGKVSNASVIVPFGITVDSEGKHKNPKSDFTFTLNTLNKDNTIGIDENGVATEYIGYFSPVTEAPANTPFMVNVTDDASGDDKISFIATETGAKIEKTPATNYNTTNYLFTGESVTGIKVGDNTYAFNNYGGYSGKEYNKSDVKIFYFANNKYVTSEELMRATVKVYPFRAVYDYSGSTLSAKAFPGFKVAFGQNPNGTATAIEDVEVANCDLAVSAGNGIITVESAIDQPVKIASMSGVSVLSVNAKAGETYTKRVPAGVYVINNKKIIVK